MYKKIPLNEAIHRLKLEKDIIIIDVRTEEEFLKNRIPKAINIPLEEIENIENRISNKNKKIFVYCQSGRRSKIACNFLETIGYTNIYDLGGINDWGQYL